MKIVKIVSILTLLMSLIFGGIPNGGFEGSEPNYFSPGGTSTTADVTWGTDAYRTGGHSLKISKPNADGTASWVSEDLYRYWSIYVGQDVGLQVGAFVKLDGVNTSPANDDEKVQLVFNFLDENGADLLGAPYIIDVDQSSGSTGWVEVASVDPLSFAVTVSAITVEFRMGANAIGTAYVDDWFIRNTVADTWAGDFFNPNVDVPDGWHYWWPDFSAGKTDWETDAPVYMGQSTAESHTGSASVQMTKDGTGYELTVNSDPTDFTNDGTPLVFSVWIKANLADGLADSVNSDPSYGMGFTVTWHDGTMGADGWGQVGGADFQFQVAGDTTDWTQYQAVFTPPAEATQFSIRARYWHFFRGTAYWDDFEVKKAYGSESFTNGGFEGSTPNYFSPGGTSTTADVAWGTDAYRTGGHSLKISKPNADGTASWVSEDLYRFWSIYVGQNVGLQVGAFVKLEGVNTNPANDDEKVQLVFNFLDENGADLLGAPYVIDVDQSAASTGWVEVASADPLSFAVTVSEITVEFKMGANATGTAYVDDWFIRPTTSGEWAGDFFNPNVDVPDGWHYWWPDFSAGKTDWETDAPVYMGQSTAESHTGSASVQMTKDGTGYELTVNSDPTDFTNDGTPLVFSVWIKANLADGLADSVNSDPSYGMGFTVTWHDGTMGADGWGQVGGADFQFQVAGDTTDWTQYQAVFTPPAEATQFSIRARYWHFFRGTAYWDDFEVLRTQPLAIEEDGSAGSLPVKFAILDAYPNPFNPTVQLVFNTQHRGNVSLVVYDLLGKPVATLVDNNMAMGRHTVQWDAIDDNGKPVPTGVYLVRIVSDGGISQIRKITYLK